MDRLLNNIKLEQQDGMIKITACVATNVDYSFPVHHFCSHNLQQNGSVILISNWFVVAVKRAGLKIINAHVS